MLVELYRYLTTPCPRPVRDMGYLKEMIGLEARARRCKNAWQPHLELSRALIIEAAWSCQRRRRVVVLGSGGLFDIPLDDLCELFADVVLIDILHLPAVRAAAARYGNVTLQEHDLAAVIDPLYRQVREATPMALPDADLPLDGADLVISANVVSQLPVIPLAYAGQAGRHSAAGLSVLAKTLIEAHLAALAAFPGVVCLITEVEHLILAGETIVSRSDPLRGAVVPAHLGHNRRFWDWDFAPRPERHKHQDRRYRIEGFIRPSNI